jgi:putative addiction module killer protein
MRLRVQSIEEFRDWLDALRDQDAKAKILVRIERLAMGNPGDVKSCGGGLSELRIHYGPGYRIYYWQRGEAALLLRGGMKSTQRRDMREAKELMRKYR